MAKFTCWYAVVYTYFSLKVPFLAIKALILVLLQLIGTNIGPTSISKAIEDGFP